MEFLNFWVLCVFWLVGSFTASANILLIAQNATLSFEDFEANFAPSVEGSGKCGKLYVAEPLNACSTLIPNKIVPKGKDTVLIIRGGCSFEDKVRRAQAAGFKAAIVYDNQDGDLIAMAGKSAGIQIYAVFVSKADGEALAKYSQAGEAELWIVPNFENSAWSVMAMSFISLLAMSAVLAACFFVRRHRIRSEQPPRTPYVQEFHGMSKSLVKAMPSLTFTSVLEDNCTSRTCAICLEDYNVGDKIRILPCRHKFHCLCVDAWLTSWRTFCPVCKRDARTNTVEPAATESTPLLSSGAASLSSYSVLSSMRLPSVASAIHISPPSFPIPHPQSISSTTYNHHSHHLSGSQSSVDLRNTSSQRSDSAYLVSPHSGGYPWLSSFNSGYMSQYIPSPGNGLNSSYVGPSVHYNESAASAHSPAEC